MATNMNTKFKIQNFKNKEIETKTFWNEQNTF